MDFGTIKNTFTEILIESHIKGDDKGKNLYKKFLRTLKESETLKTYFVAYKNLEDKTFNTENEATEYIKEHVSILKKYKGQKSIFNENKKLINLLESNGYKITQKPNDLHKALNNLIRTNKDVTTIDTIIESTNILKKHLITPKTKLNENLYSKTKFFKEGDKIKVTRLPEEKPNDRLPRGYENLKIGDVLTVNKIWSNTEGVIYGTDFSDNYGLSNYDVENLTGKKLKENKVNPNKFLNIVVEKYNEKYSNMDEQDKKIIKTILSSNEKEKETLLNNLKKESINLITKLVKEYDNNLEVKVKLLESKDFIYNMGFNKETFKDDVVKIYDLMKNLS
jgi:hypothetical protein